MHVDTAVILSLITGYNFTRRRDVEDFVSEHFAGDEQLAIQRVMQQQPGLKTYYHMSGYDRNNASHYLQEAQSTFGSTMWIA
jgi:hypothetical protein